MLPNNYTKKRTFLLEKLFCYDSIRLKPQIVVVETFTKAEEPYNLLIKIG